MKKGTKYFLYFIIFITLVIVFYRFQQYIINKNFVLKVNAVCNPGFEKCFVADCSIADDKECDTTPYKKVEVADVYAPDCLEEHSCSAFDCSGRDRCLVTYCSLDTIENGEKCFESVVNQ